MNTLAAEGVANHDGGSEIGIRVPIEVLIKYSIHDMEGTDIGGGFRTDRLVPTSPGGLIEGNIVGLSSTSHPVYLGHEVRDNDVEFTPKDALLRSQRRSVFEPSCG